MSLHIEYRPQTFDEVIGNSELVESLSTILKNKKRPHSYLLTGPTGCGKTTIGRIIAKELGCSDQDFKEIDSADFRGIDSVREIRKQLGYYPIDGDVRVWLIDEVHKATNDAQNAMLKMLEDTPFHVYFILCTTDPQKLLKTVKTRCTQFEVQKLTAREMTGLIRRVTKAEDETLQKQIYDQIIKSADGHPRSALQLLTKVLGAAPENRIEIAKQHEEAEVDSIELCRALLSQKSWGTVREILTKIQKQEPESIRRMVLAYCKSVLLKGDNTTAGLIMGEFIDPFYDTGFPGLVYACYSVVQG